MTDLAPLAATHVDSLVLVLKSLTLVLGGLIAWFAHKAYRRTASAPLQLLAVGFVLVTLGSMLAGVVDQVAGLPLDQAIVVQSALTAVGFGTILYSLYSR